MEQEYDKLNLPKLLGQELANEPMMLPEVIQNNEPIPTKLRIQSSRKPEA